MIFEKFKKRNNVNIFIVEDDNVYAHLLQKSLMINGFENVIIFNDATLLFEKIKNCLPDIIIQDYELPGMSGYDIYQEIKKIYPQVDFIFLSGQNNINIAINLIKSGIFDYITKDAKTISILIEKIDNWISKKNYELKIKSLRKTLIITIIFVLIFLIIVLMWIIFSLRK